MEPILVSELKPGATFAALLLVNSASVRVSRLNSEYLHLELRDRTGAVVYGRQFDIDGSWKPSGGDVVAIKGAVEQFNGMPSLRIAELRKGPEGSASLFIPKARSDPQQMRRMLEGFIAGIAHPQLSLLLERCFAEPFLGQFCQAPASVMYHQAVAGGLLEHTVAVARICRGVAQFYRVLDRDLLLAGALLHDIGKVEELTAPPSLGYTSGGKALGHIVLGLLLVSRHVETLSDFPPALREQLYHLIASHHGSREFGSPVVPSSLEAVALFHADLMDSKLSGFMDVVQRTRPGEDWTPYAKMFQSELRMPDGLDRLLES